MDLFLQTLLNGTANGAGFALIAVGLTLVFGILHIVNFAHGAFFALGGYATLVAMSLGLPYWLGLMVGIGVVVAAGFATEKLIIGSRLYGQGNYASLVITFALAQAMTAVMLLVAGPNPQPMSSPVSDVTLRFGGFFVPGQRALIFVVSVLVLTGFGIWLKWSKRGRQIQAVAQNPRGALYSGINVPRIRTLSFMLGVGSAGIAGGLIAPITNVYPTMGNASLITAFIVVILGGLGSISGSLLGAMIMGIATALFETYVSVTWTPALGWVMVILLLLVAPQGLRGKALSHRF